jgi:hypothetical protein
MAEMNAPLKAGAMYFAVVFFIAFVLGTVRVLFVAPRFGETIAVMIEAPVILVVSWFASRRCVRVFKVRAETAPRLLMGGVAFAMLMAAELGLSVAIPGRSVASYVAGFLSVPGAIGLAAQLAFGVIPMVQGREGQRSKGEPMQR